MDMSSSALTGSDQAKPPLHNEAVIQNLARPILLVGRAGLCLSLTRWTRSSWPIWQCGTANKFVSFSQDNLHCFFFSKRKNISNKSIKKNI